MDEAADFPLNDEGDFWVSPQGSPDQSPLATIVVPTYRAEATLLRALRSALDQTLQNIEVIVVDDASPDLSWTIIKALVREDRRVRAIKNKQNRGKPVGMNRAIALARGKWVAVLDADDWYHPDRLSSLIALGEARGVDMVADNQFFYDAKADAMVGTAWPTSGGDWLLTLDGFLEGSDAYRTFNLGMLKPVSRLDFIRKTGLTYEERARHGQDFFNLLQFYLSGGSAAVSDIPYYYYTQPFGELSHEWSHAGRARYDFQTAYAINQSYLAIARQSLTPRQTAYLKRRTSRLKSLEYFYQMKECLAAFNLAGAAARVVYQPALLGYVARRIYAKCLRNRTARPWVDDIEHIAIQTRQAAKAPVIRMSPQ